MRSMLEINNIFWVLVSPIKNPVGIKTKERKNSCRKIFSFFRASLNSSNKEKKYLIYLLSPILTL